MSLKKTTIEWTDLTWNPWQGCKKVSAGCKNCYMFRDKSRYGQNPEFIVRSKPATFNRPLTIKERSKIFTCSWSDFFHKDIDNLIVGLQRENTAIFVKQLGTHLAKQLGLKDRHGRKWDEWPDNLKIRVFPTIKKPQNGAFVNEG